MQVNDVRIIGGGPAGLFAAILLKRVHPAAAVTIYERSVPDDTFGFGVAFTRRTLELLSGADEGVVRRLLDASVAMPRQEMRVGQDSAFSAGNDGAIGIARSALLGALLDEATSSGVAVELGRAVISADSAVSSASSVALDEVRGADLVIAADGVASTARGALANDFGARVEEGRGLFMWLGLDRRLESNLFAPLRTADGLFNIHCYPYAEDRSTIGVETDVDTWRRAGMERWTDETPADESDKRSIEYLQDLFGPTLGRANLLGNRSRWMRFRTVSARRWCVGNVVLIGDAAHTAHYSVGSGTKMAMEDSVALVDALRDPGQASLPQALAAYERARRPRVERIQDLADRSRWWWETLEQRLDLPPATLMLAYLSRGGAVSATKVAEGDPALLAQALPDYGVAAPDGSTPSLADAVLQSPVTVSGRSLRSRVLGPQTAHLSLPELAADVRDPWGAEAEAVVRAANRAARAGADAVVLTGSPQRERLLDRLALAENVRRHCDVPVAVEADPLHVDDVVDAVIARRIDLVRYPSPTTVERQR